MSAVAAIRPGRDVFARAWARGLRPTPPLSLSEWADAHRVLPRKGAAEPGRWRTDRTPYLREIMDELSPDSGRRRVVFMKPTQVGATEIGNNWVGYVIDHQPGPMMVVQPTVDLAQRWSRQRLSPMIEESSRLRSKIRPARSRDSGNTTLLKEFPAGVLVISGANSAAGLRSMPVRDLFLDEVDAYPPDVDDEGGAIELAERRTSTFARRKIFIASTPTLKGFSAIEAEYEASDQRRYHVPCPSCAEYQVLRDEGLTDDGRYLCEHCGELIEEHQKPAMLAAGRWVAAHPGRATAGFHLNSLYTPLGLGYSWQDIADERTKAKADALKLKTYTNTLLGEPYEDESGKVEPDELQGRAEPWKLRTIPPGHFILTAGVDVQHNRLEVLVAAWGRGERCAIVDWVQLPGDPTRAGVWEDLEAYLRKPIANCRGRDIRISVAAVDSGNWTHEVYSFVRSRPGVLAIKGMSTGNKPVIAARPSAQDVNIRGRTLAGGVDLWRVGTDTAKTTLFGRIKGDATAEVEARKVRFSEDLPADFFEQLTAERFDPVRGLWVKAKGRRNEALDCLVYAYAAACYPVVRVHMLREGDWAKLEAAYEPVNEDLFDAPAAQAAGAETVAPDPAPAPDKPPTAKRPRRRRGFVHR